MAVLLFSSGGPFFASETDTIAGLSLLVPTVLLVCLSACMLLYSFGNPLSGSVQKKNRIGVVLALVAIIVFAAAALGKALVLNVAADPRTPKVGQSQALFQSLLQTSLRDRRDFYRLASEVALARTYQKYFRAVTQDRQSVAPQPTDQNNRAEKQPSSNLQLDKNDSETLSRSQAEPTKEPSSVRNVARGSGTEDESSKEHGITRTEFLVDFFRASDGTIKEQYLTHRLEWIHPVGLEGQSVAPISLPGTSPEERFEGVGNLRIFLALYNQPNFRQTILREFEYPEQTSQYFGTTDETTGSRAKLFGNDSNPPDTLYRPTLFPKFEATINDSQLRQQLSLPIRPEAYVAFKQYKDLALLIVQDEFRSRLPSSDFDRLTNSFNSLDDKAQDAFLYYVINNRKMPSEYVYQMLIDLKGIDFGALANSLDPVAVEKVISIIQGNKLDDRGLQDLADKVTHSESRQAKDTFLALLKNEDPEVPIKRLFQPQVFDLVNDMHKLLGSDKQAFFNAVGDPVWVVAKHIAVTDVGERLPRSQNERLLLSSHLDDFRKLSDQDESGLLQQLAITLYQPGGPYSLDPIRSLVFQAKSWNDATGVFCATLLTVPVLLLCLLIGAFLSRKLVARDRNRNVINEERASYPEITSSFGNPVEVLYGRDETVGNLRKLAERGWSTIGIVGRRGVGKSRVLYSLFRSESPESLNHAIRTWVSAPSKFEEEDFVFSVFERLALSTEQTIASYLGANPISIRRIEHRTAVIAAWNYVGSLFVLAIIIYEMFNRLTRSDIVVTWLPILVLIVSSIWVFVYYFSKRQPVDLSSWLQRDRRHNLHTVMLYKDVYEALNMLRNRREGRFDALYWLRSSALKQIAMSAFAILFSLSIGYIVLTIESSYSDVALILTLFIAGLSGWAWLYLFQRRGNLEVRGNNFGQSIMSLVADYRGFATTIVHRLSQGALAQDRDRRPSILVCIDELDKIVGIEDIKTFLRQIKAIFEVPGVYYYVSLAEDTLTALYLGTASGKNEIDSAFDHIVRIPPLSCNIGERIAVEYLTGHDFINQPNRLARSIAAVSFGIPRDIIRRCDEVIARRDRSSLQVPDIPRSLRHMQARMGYELHQVTKDQMNGLIDTASKSALTAQSLSRGSSDDAQQRLILATWVLSLLEIASTLPNNQRWESVSEELSSLGYRLPSEPVADLRNEVERVHEPLFVEEDR